MPITHQHIVYCSILPMEMLNNHKLKEKIVNHGSVDSFYNGNRLDENGYWIGIRISTLKVGENNDMDEFYSKFKGVKDKNYELWKTLFERFIGDEELKETDPEEFVKFVANIRSPNLYIIPETE